MGAQTGDSVVLQGDFNETCKTIGRRNGLPDMNLNGGLLLDFCASHSLTTVYGQRCMDTIFEHKAVYTSM